MENSQYLVMTEVAIKEEFMENEVYDLSQFFKLVWGKYLTKVSGLWAMYIKLVKLGHGFYGLLLTIPATLTDKAYYILMILLYLKLQEWMQSVGMVTKKGCPTRLNKV
jgi:hypothetical protein